MGKLPEVAIDVAGASAAGAAETPPSIQKKFPFEKPFSTNGYLGRVKNIPSALPTLLMLDANDGEHYSELDIDVIVLDINEDGTCLEPITFDSKSREGDSDCIKRLRTNEVFAALKETLERGNPPNAMIRLILVEDLSLATIEALGSTLNLEPKFFTEHINLESDYTIRIRQSKISIDIEAPSKSTSFVEKPEQFFSMRWKRTYLRYKPSPANTSKISFKNLPIKVQLQLMKAMHRTKNRFWWAGDWSKEKAEVIAVEERLTYMEREDDRGLIGVFLFLSPREMSFGRSEYKSRGLDVDVLGNRTIYSCLDPKFAEESATFFGQVVETDTSTARSQFLNYVAGPKSKPPGAIVTGKNIYLSKILSQLVFPNCQDILSEMDNFLDAVDKHLSDHQALQTKITGRTILANYQIYLIKYRDMIAEIQEIIRQRELQQPQHDAAKVLLQHVENLMERTGKTFSASIAIVESQRAIQEAESITRLTELAFIFIPLSFATSVFGMQIPGWSENFRPEMFGITVATLICGAYGFRLFIRSRILRKGRKRLSQSVRIANGLSEGESIPTTFYLRWLADLLVRFLRKWHWSTCLFSCFVGTSLGLIWSQNATINAKIGASVTAAVVMFTWLTIVARNRLNLPWLYTYMYMYGCYPVRNTILLPVAIFILSPLVVLVLSPLRVIGNIFKIKRIEHWIKHWIDE